ncbi:hypothetical protein GCM10027275_06550 [Rhabdobacter roseus]|uniref:LamG domain-containing protein n=1 Tax=Rhabdobacter roseus TaxID=1655419 RepID=A0A840TLW8_9BACT|nr:LamG domain-containing protein [Rhabdobacter roseus]MBB5282552.1 hypothetical protein [Rhabdobacter roseus]
MRKYSNIFFKSVLVCLAVGTFSCQNFERPEMMLISDDDPALSGPLQRFWAFEGVATDSILGSRGTSSGNVSYVDGVRGRAYKGSTTGQIEYASAGKLATMESFTVAFWMNTTKHTGGAQAVFMLPNTEDFWGNMFMLIEGNDSATDSSMIVKFHFGGNWVEFTGNGTNANGLNRWPNAYGRWKHVAFSYDAATSKFAAYVDGQKLNLAASVTDRVRNNAPLGALKFSNASKFVIGGFQQHIGIRPPADAWMLRYTGMLDQFRIYTQALTDAEVKDLFDTKK